MNTENHFYHETCALGSMDPPRNMWTKPCWEYLHSSSQNMGKKNVSGPQDFYIYIYVFFTTLFCIKTCLFFRYVKCGKLVNKEKIFDKLCLSKYPISGATSAFYERTPFLRGINYKKKVSRNVKNRRNFFFELQGDFQV